MIFLTKNIFRNLFSRPATRPYPAEKRPAFEGARGQLKIEIEKCIFCGACQKRCPADAITVTRDPKAWDMSPYKCVICGYCVDVCPKKCLYLDKDYRPPVRTT